MKKSDKSMFKTDCLIGYRQLMQPLYIKWGKQYTTEELRAEFLKFVLDNFITKSKDNVRQKAKRKMKKRLAKKIAKNLPIVEGNIELNKEQFGNEEELFSDIIK